MKVIDLCKNPTLNFKYAIAKVNGDLEQAIAESGSCSGNLAIPFIFDTEDEARHCVENMLTTFCAAMESLKENPGNYDYEVKTQEALGDIFYTTKGYFKGDCKGRVTTYYVITLIPAEYKR